MPQVANGGEEDTSMNAPNVDLDVCCPNHLVATDDDPIPKSDGTWQYNVAVNGMYRTRAEHQSSRQKTRVKLF